MDGAKGRTEMIADSVRKTEVEVEDERGQTQSQNGLGQSQSQGFRRD